MKNILGLVIVVVGLALVMFMVNKLMGAIHPPNDNILCKRVGCGHYHNQHERGNGMCEYFDPYILPGHCPGFIK